jgi:hypothetical protein
MLTKVGWFLLMMSVPVAAGGQTAGTITGVVVNEKGAPVAQAEVRADELTGLPAIHTVLQFHETDAEGHFIIQNLRWGTYRLSARKPDEGYPDPAYEMYPEHSEYLPLVTLQPASPVVTLTLRLPPKAGAIESISVVDAMTGMKMNAAITARRVAEPAIFFMTSTTMTPVLVPSNTDVSIEISASGYKPWPAKDEPKSKGQIRLSSEQGVKLEVKLAPDGSKVNSIALFSPAPYSPARNAAKPGPKPGNLGLVQTVIGFNVIADCISVPLETLAQQYHVPIGFEALPRGSGTQRAASVHIDVRYGTVRDVLNVIMAADPVYMWEESKEGVINVYPRDHAGSFPDVEVTEYSDPNVYRDGAINDLLKSSEVQRWMEAGVRPHYQGNTATQSSPGGPLIYHIAMPENSSVRSILNSILTLTGSNYWVCRREGDHNQYLAITISD